MFVCIATGPSLTRADCVIARDKGDRLIVVNDAYTICPEADYLYAADPHWWRAHIETVRETFHGERWTQKQNGKGNLEEEAVIKEYGLHHKPSAPRGDGLGKDALHLGSHSGYQAINLAYLFGAKRIALLGYDMQLTGGKHHFFGAHTKVPQVDSRWPEWVQSYEALARGLASESVEVVNCSRATAIEAFPRTTIDAL